MTLCPLVAKMNKLKDRPNGRSFFGRSVGIRTRGLLDPNQARYQTSPHPDKLNHYKEIIIDCQVLPCWLRDANTWHFSTFFSVKSIEVRL